MISAGRLDKGKNYISAIKAIAKLKGTDLHYLICGVGPDEIRLKRLCEEYGVIDRVHFLGFRNDVIELMKISDIFLFTSFREGLPRVTMEAMATGLPCIVSDIRGNVDLIKESEGGFLCDSSDIEKISEKINFLC